MYPSASKIQGRSALIAGLPPWKDARVLVTGASGRIGGRVAQTLFQAGADVHVCQREPDSQPPGLSPAWSKAHCLDLTDTAAVLKLFDEIKPNYVVHAATWRPKDGKVDRLAMVQTNVIGANNLIEAASRNPLERFVYLGSSLEYGRRDEPLHEDMLPAPTTLHGASKASATLLFQQAARSNAMANVILRLFSVYGPGEHGHRLIPTAIRAVRDGAPIELTTPGIRRDFVFVDDVVEAIILALKTPLSRGEILNVGTGIQTSNEQVVDMIAALLGRSASVEVGAFPTRDTDSGYWVADVSRCKERLGWSAQHDLRTGLKATIDWFLDRDAESTRRAY